MVRTVLQVFCFCLAASCVTSAVASSEESKVLRTVEQTLSLKSKPSSIRKIPKLDLYEIVADKNIFYVDKNVRYVIAGQIFDTQQKVNITEKRIAELSKIPWKSLPLKDAIKVVYGKGERRLAVFTDTNCTYCQLLEQSIRQIGNITVYNFLHPTPRSRDLSRRIFCAPDPARAFQDYMLSGKQPDHNFAGKCDSSALDRNLALGRRLGIAGTPVMIFSDGSSQAGSLAPSDLNARLNSVNGE